MCATGMVAADERVKGSNPMDKAVFNEKIECAIDSRRGGPPTVLLGQNAKDVVGAQRRMTLPDEFQHALAQRRQPYTGTGTERVGIVEGL